MASVCGGSMAMMDAGVPIESAVAGIAMGLIMDEKTGKYAILSDIAGAEDPLRRHGLQGRGTAQGITALQMDIKVTGITRRSWPRRSSRREPAGMHILGEMAKTLQNTRGNMSDYAPRIITIKIRSTRFATSSAPAAR
jgi:polyribonucleotide nucleotidyltransferase